MCPPIRGSFAAALLALALAPAAAHAQTNWLGATNSDWGTASNWSAGVPTNMVDATFSAVANQTITLSANQSVRATTFNSATAYSIGGASTLTLNGNVTQSGAGAVAISTNLNLGGTVRGFGGAGTGEVTLSGAVSSGIMVVNLSAATATLTLGGTASNAIPVNVSNAVLRLNKPDGVTAVTTLTVNTGSEVRFLAGNQVDGINMGTGNGVVELNGFSETVGSLTSNTTSTGQVRLGSGSLTVNSGASFFMSGAEITGTGGSVARQGLGLWVLDRAGGNSYTGGTTVGGGTLDIRNTSGSALGTGPVQVNSGGTLRGSGSAAGAVTVAGGGTIAADVGAGAGRTLDLGGLTLSATSTTRMSIRGFTPGDTDTSYSQINVAGAADLDGTLSITLGSLFVPTGGSFFILSRDSGTGAFAMLPEGTTVQFGGYLGTITYFANWTGSQATSTLSGGNDVAIYNVAPVPEPVHALAVCAAAVGIGWWRRRRKGG